MARPKVRPPTFSVAIPTVNVICNLLHTVVVENDVSSLKFLAHPIVILRKTLIQAGFLDCHLLIFSEPPASILRRPRRPDSHHQIRRKWRGKTHESSYNRRPHRELPRERHMSIGGY